MDYALRENKPLIPGSRHYYGLTHVSIWYMRNETSSISFFSSMSAVAKSLFFIASYIGMSAADDSLTKKWVFLFFFFRNSSRLSKAMRT